MSPAETQPSQQQRRFGQGNDVIRDRPHFFHRDYWALRHIRSGLLQFLDQYGGELAGKQCLDYGAGDSPYAPHFARRNIAFLRSDIRPADPGIVRIAEDGTVDLPNASVDAIVSTQVLEHVPDVQRYLAEGMRVLRPGGLFYCSTHGTFILHRCPADYHRWTIDGLRLEFERAGMEVAHVEPRIGLLATTTHMRSIAIGGLTRRVPLTGWLRPIIYGVYNVRMAIEEAISPPSIEEALPTLVLLTARKPR